MTTDEGERQTDTPRVDRCSLCTREVLVTPITEANGMPAMICARCALDEDDCREPGLSLPGGVGGAVSDEPREPTDEEIAALIEPKEEVVPVIIAVHNGLTVNGGQPMFVPSHYLVPISRLQQVQRFLSKHEVLG